MQTVFFDKVDNSKQILHDREWLFSQGQLVEDVFTASRSALLGGVSAKDIAKYLISDVKGDDKHSRYMQINLVLKNCIKDYSNRNKQMSGYHLRYKSVTAQSKLRNQVK